MKTVADIAVPDQAPAAPTPLRLLNQVRARIRVLHYSIRTEQAYLDWIKRYIRFLDKRHPRAALRFTTPHPNPPRMRGEGD